MAIALSVALIITCAVAAVIVTPQAGLSRVQVQLESG
jgi:hypothetical protein